MSLHGAVVPSDSVGSADVREMIRLLGECFENIDQAAFLSDLREKDEVVLLRDGAGCLCGFSTLVHFSHRFEGSLYRVVFSGDTVISPSHWGGTELPVVWGAHLMQLYQRDPEQPLLWLLISKGIRTFKFLPVFFRDYYPSPTRATPAGVQSLMHSLGERRFAEQYDRLSGLVLPCEQSYFLRPEFAKQQTSIHARRYIDHFYAKNPLYQRGAELLCLTEFSPQNLKSFISRRIATRQTQREMERRAA